MNHESRTYHLGVNPKDLNQNRQVSHFMLWSFGRDSLKSAGAGRPENLFQNQNRYLDKIASSSGVSMIKNAAAIVAVAVALALSGCSDKKQNDEPQGQLERRGDPVLVRQNHDGTVKVYSQSMDPADIKFTRAAYAETALALFPIDSKHGTTLRQMNVSKFENFVFIEPSLFIYGPNESQVRMRKLGNGNVSISFAGVFFDGVSPRVPSVHRGKYVSVPEASRIAYPKELQASLGSKTLATLPGCLEAITIQVEGREYVATPEFLGTELCSLENRPMSMSAVIPEGDVPYLFELMESGHVQVNVRYQVGVPFSPKSIVVKFNKSMLLKQLKSRFSSQTIYADVEIKAFLREMFEGQEFQIIYQGSLSHDKQGIIEHLVRASIEEFFKPRAPVTPEESSKCSDQSVVCLRLAVTQVKEDEVFNAEVREETTALTKVRLATWASLKPQYRTVAAISKLAQGQAAPTTITVGRGSPLRIEMQSAEIERRFLYNEEWPKAPSSWTSQINTCPSKVWRKECDCCHCWDNLECTAPQDQGFRTFRMWLEENSFPTIYDRVDQPIGKIPDDLYLGLRLEATYKQNGEIKKITCQPHMDFVKSTIRGAMVYMIDDTASCPLFETVGSDLVTLTVRNEVEGALREVPMRTVSRNWQSDAVNAAPEFSDKPNVVGKFSYRPRILLSVEAAQIGMSSSAALGK